MNFFRKLQAEGLRRLVKVVLNRTVGPFLENRIELEQLELEAETGLFHIRDVPLCCAALNEFLDESSVCITEATVAELVVSISWAAVNDGCKITLDGVRLSLCRSQTSGQTDSPKGPNIENVAASSASSTTSSVGSIDEDEGVLFLANWIDIVVSRFHVEMKNVQVDIIGDNNSCRNAIRLRVSELHYFNSKPESSSGSIVSGGTVANVTNSVSVASQSISRASGRLHPAVASVKLITSQEAHNSKLLTFSGFWIDIVSNDSLGKESVLLGSELRDGGVIAHTYRSELLSCEGNGRILIRGDSNKQNRTSSTDVNLSFPPISSYFNLKYISAIKGVVEKVGFSKDLPVKVSSSTDLTNDVVGGSIYGVQDKFRAITFERTMRVLDGLSNDKDLKGCRSEICPDVDVAKLTRMLKIYQDIRNRLENEGGGDMSAYMSDAFSSAVDPMGREGELAGLSYRNPSYTTGNENTTSRLIDSSFVSVVSENEDEAVISEDDIDVVSVEEDDTDVGDFFDASQGQGMSRVSLHKYDRTPSVKESMRSRSRSLHPTRNGGANKNCGFSIRLIVPSLNIVFAEAESRITEVSHFLKLCCGDLHASIQIPALLKHDAASPTKLTLNLNSMALLETSVYPNRPSIFPFLYFGAFDNSESKTVFPKTAGGRGPQNNSNRAGGISITDDADLEVHVDFVNKKKFVGSKRNDIPDVSISLKLNPVVLVLSPEVILRWNEEISSIMITDDSPSASSFSISADIASVNILMCPVSSITNDLRPPRTRDTFKMLGFVTDENRYRELKFSRWMKRACSMTEHARLSLARLNRHHIFSGRSSENPFVNCPHDTFIRIYLHNVRLKLLSNVISSPATQKFFVPAPIVELTELNVYMRLEDNVDNTLLDKNVVGTMELKFVSSEGSADRKISVRKFVESDFAQDASSGGSSQLPTILKSRMSRQEPRQSTEKSDFDGCVPSSSAMQEASPLPPPLHGGEIFVIDAHLIRLDLQQKEYSMLIGLIDFFIPTTSVAPNTRHSAEFSSSESKLLYSGALPKGIGVKLTAEIFICSLAQDEIIDYLPAASKSSGTNHKEDRCTYILSTREPLIEFYQSFIPKNSGEKLQSHIFFGLEVENLSAFELTDEQMKNASCGSGISAIGVRVGPNAHNIPIVHVTTFARDWQTDDDNTSGNKSIIGSIVGASASQAANGSRNWTLSVGALITEDKVLNTLSTSLHLDFQDVTIRYDPLSRWLFNLIDILTPLTLKELIPSFNHGKSMTAKPINPSALQSPIETLHLRVTVRQALLDYCAVIRPIKNENGEVLNSGTDFGASSEYISAPRMLVSLGKLVVGTTIISKSHQLGLKIGVSDISLRLTNSILRDNRFELVPLGVNGVFSTIGQNTQLNDRNEIFRPCCRYFEDFIDAHAFVRMGKIRKIEMMLRINGGIKLGQSGEEIDDDSGRIDIAATVDDIYCCGCADSLNILGDAINTLVADLKKAGEYVPHRSKTVRGEVESEKKYIKTRNDHCFRNLDEPLNSFSSQSNDETDDIFYVRKRSDDISSKHSSSEDLNAAHSMKSLTPPARKTVLRPPALLQDQVTFNSGAARHLFQDDKEGRQIEDFENLAEPMNILRNIDKDMFAPKNNDDNMSSRMSIRSNSESVLMEAIFDDDYFVQHDNANLRSQKDLGEFDIQLKRSEKLSTCSKIVPEQNLSYIQNSNNRKKKTLFNSAFDEETEAIFLADLPADDMSDEESDDSSQDVYMNQYSAERDKKPQWSLFRPKPDDPYDRELLSLPDASEFKDSLQSQVIEVNLAPPIPVALWKVHAAAGLDQGANVASYKEESTVLQGEDTFVVVDYSDPMDNSQPEVKWFDGKEELAAGRINPHHIPMLVSNEEAEDIEAVQPKILVKVVMSVKFQLLQGKDWSTNQESSAAALRKQLLRRGGLYITKGESAAFIGNERSTGTKKHSVKHKVLFADEEPTKKDRCANNTIKGSAPQGSSAVNKDRAELSLHGLSVRFAMYAPDEDNIVRWPVQRTIVKVKDIDVKFYRKNHRTKMVLGYWKSHKPGETDAPILKVHLDTFVDTVSRAHLKEDEADEPGLGGKGLDSTDARVGESNINRDIEHVNKISIELLPLSCNLDAPFLDLVRSLGETFKPCKVENEPNQKTQKIASGEDNISCSAEQEGISSVPASMPLSQLERERPLFFQQWKMSPISLKICYEPRAFDVVKFQAGDYIEILNCFPLDGLEITMRKTILYGVTGVEGGIDNTLRLWVDQIRDNQLSTIGKVLSGVAPLKGVASIGKGLHHHLFIMPRKEFNRRGTSGALHSVAGGVAAVSGTVFKEAMHVGAQATQMIANLLYRVADPLITEHHTSQHRNRPSRHSSQMVDSRRKSYNSRPLHRKSDRAQPANVVEGGHMAFDAFTNSVASAVDNIVLVPIREYQRSGAGGVVSSVIRAVPIAVLGPAAGAAQAVSYTFLGMRNQVDPRRRRDEEAIYVDIEKSEQYDSGFRG